MPDLSQTKPAARDSDQTIAPEAHNPRNSPDSPETQQPSTVATPEGDNEYRPDQPLTPAPDGLQRTPAIDTNEI